MALLAKHIDNFVANTKKNPDKFQNDYKERLDQVAFYQGYSKDKMLSMSEEDIYKYISDLWAMLIWGNKHYVVDKIIEDNGLQDFRKRLADLVWGEKDIKERWNTFRTMIKGMGPAMISEILCKTHPNDYMIWNRRAYAGLNYLGVDNLPRYDYQMDGKRYKHLCDVSKEISKMLQAKGVLST